MDTLLTEFDNARGGCPVALDRRADFLSRGPENLTDKAAYELMEKLVSWGVCEAALFNNGRGGPLGYVTVYSGLAGLLDRHVQGDVPVPFYAPCEAVRIMYDLGKKVHGFSGHEYAMYHYELDKTMKARRKLQRQVICNGGNMSSGEFPGTQKLITAQNALIADHTKHLPTADHFATISEVQNLKKCQWSENRWKDTFTRDYDLDSDEENTTMQEFIVPLLKNAPTMAYEYPKWVDPHHVQGKRKGQMQIHNAKVVNHLNPSFPPHEVNIYIAEYVSEAQFLHPEDDPHESSLHAGHWFGALDAHGGPEGKGIAVFALGELQGTDGYGGKYGRNRGHPDDKLQYNGTMEVGQPHGFGDLVHEGHTLYSGMWKLGTCESDGKNLPGCKRMTPRQVYRYYLMRKEWFCRFEPASTLRGEKPCLEIKGWNMNTGQFQHYQFSPMLSIQSITKQYKISPHVMRYIRRPDVKRIGTWADFTVGCSTQEYVKLIQCRYRKGFPLSYVTSAIGPRESYANEDEYEYAPYAYTGNGFSMFQNFLNPLNLVGLEAVGASSGGKKDEMPQFLGKFRSIDNRYRNVEENKWSLTNEFVMMYFSRYIEVLFQNVNHMLDLQEIGKQDRLFVENDPASNGWLLYPRSEGLTFPKFRFWKDRPIDLATIVQGCVYNLYEVQYAPGGRWRFFGRFNHRVAIISQTWYQLEESWMSKYLVPKCVEDLHMEAPAFARVDVHKTGNDGDSSAMMCVKQCVLPIVPPDDAEVLRVVNNWAKEVVFHLTVGRMCDLTSVSTKYMYNSQKLSAGALDDFFNKNHIKQTDQDVIIRPIDPKGESCGSSLSLMTKSLPLTVTFTSVRVVRMGVPRLLASKKRRSDDHLRADGQRCTAMGPRCFRYRKNQSCVCRYREASQWTGTHGPCATACAGHCRRGRPHVIGMSAHAPFRPRSICFRSHAHSRSIFFRRIMSHAFGGLGSIRRHDNIGCIVFRLLERFAGIKISAV